MLWALCVSQSLNLVVPVDGAWDVSNPAINPSTSSRVSTTSRTKTPTTRVSARPTVGGVGTRRLRMPIAEAIRRRRSAKDIVSGPAASAVKLSLEDAAATICAARSSA